MCREILMRDLLVVAKWIHFVDVVVAVVVVVVAAVAVVVVVVVITTRCTPNCCCCCWCTPACVLQYKTRNEGEWTKERWLNDGGREIGGGVGAVADYECWCWKPICNANVFVCMFLFFNTIYYDDLIHTATILRVPSLSIVNGKCVSKCVCLCVFKCICSLSVQYILHNIDDHSERERERDTQLTDWMNIRPSQ